jgi:hypothetical protein
MQTNRAAKCDDCSEAADAAKHDREASYHVINVNALLDLLTHVVLAGAVEPPKTV